MLPFWLRPDFGGVTISKLDNLGCHMKKLKENVHAIQVRCQIYEGPHLEKECPLNEEANQVEEAKYREFDHPALFNRNNRVKYHVGLSGYYTRTDNRPPYGEKRQSVEELMNTHMEESARRSKKTNEWITKLQESVEVNTRNQSASLKNLETQIEQLTKELQSRDTNEIPSSSTWQCKVVNDDLETQRKPISSGKLINKEGWTTKDLQCQLPPKELNLGNFTLPCTIGKFNFYGMADLGAGVNVKPRNIFEYLRLANLRNTNMLVEMADMTKKAPLGIIENVLVNIDKFLFPSYFMVIDKTPNETIILGRPFLATIHAEINVFY
ncbi:reverse transcriptase domain-containing protein [Tanacetum coccineum]